MSRKEDGANGRRYLVVSFLLILTLFVFLTSATAAGAVVSIQSAELKVGESRTLPIVLADAAEEISCATIIVSYDPAILKVTSVQNTQFDKLVYNSDTAQGKTTIVLYQTGAAGLTGTITLAELTVEALKVGTSSLTLQLETLKNNAGVPVAAAIQGGSVTVKAADGSGGGGGGGGGGGSGSSGGIATPSPSPAPSPSPSPAPSPSPSPSPSPAPSPSAPATTEPSPSLLPPGIITVRIDDLAVASSEVITATIRIEGVGGEGLSSARITLSYNPKIVKVLSANVESSEFEEFVANPESGTVRMIGYQTGAEGLTGDVTFAQLQLKATGKPGEQTALGLEVIDLIDNVGEVLVEHEDFEVVAGSLTITGEGGRKLIPTCGLVGTVAMVIGAYLLVRKRRGR
jgi:hypothetical protein